VNLESLHLEEEGWRLTNRFNPTGKSVSNIDRQAKPAKRLAQVALRHGARGRAVVAVGESSSRFPPRSCRYRYGPESCWDTDGWERRIDASSWTPAGFKRAWGAAEGLDVVK